MPLQQAVRVTEDDVILAHLMSERELELAIVFKVQQDTRNVGQNEIRRMLLYETRGGIYQRLIGPAGRIEWYRGTIDSPTFQKLKILPSEDWVDISRGTLTLADTAQRFATLNDLRVTMYPHHSENVDKYESNLDQFPITLILISTDFTGDYTIIDGVHHSIAAYRKYFLHSPTTFTPVSAYLGVCEYPCYWHAL